jgi:hypothetical protein
MVINMETVNSINFAWDRVAGANSYALSLYAQQGNAWQTVYETRVAGTTYLFTQLARLRRGRFAWEVQSLLLENESVRVTSPAARSEFTIRLPELVEIEIVTPEAIYVETD